MPDGFIMPDLREHFDLIGHLQRESFGNDRIADEFLAHGNLQFHTNQNLDFMISREPSNVNASTINNSQVDQHPLTRSQNMDFGQPNQRNTAVNDPLQQYFTSSPNQANSVSIFN